MSTEIRVHLAQSISWDDHLALSTYFRELAKALARQPSISLSLYLLGSAPDTPSLPGVEVFSLEGNPYTPSDQVRYMRSLSKRLRRHLGNGRDEVLHCIYPNSSLLPAIRARRRSNPGASIVYDVRSPWIEMSLERVSLPRSLSLPYRHLMYSSERIVGSSVSGWSFVTEGLRDWYEAMVGLNGRPVAIVPSGVDHEAFADAPAVDLQTQHGLPPGPTVGYVGALSKGRQLGTVVRALSELVDAGHDFTLGFIGDGDGREALEQESRRLALDSRVGFVGRVQPQLVPSYVAALDVAVCHLPDRFVFSWSFPLKILEYAAARIPIAASDVPCHRRLAEEFGLFLYKEDSSTDLARAILEAHSAGKRSVPHVTKYTWDAIATRFVSFYEELVG